MRRQECEIVLIPLSFHQALGPQLMLCVKATQEQKQGQDYDDIVY